MDAQHSTAALGLAEAADLAGCSRDTIRRAAQKGDLKAEMGPGVRGPQWWIQESDLREWLENRDSDAEHSSAAQQSYAEHSSAAQQRYAEHSSAAQQGFAEHSSAAQQSYAEHSSTMRSSAPQEAEWSESAPRTAVESFYQVSTAASETPSPPAEVYIALIDRLSRAERRSVELELQLRQSQRLLSENAESITEKEALAQAARAQLEAIEDAKQTEIARLAAELEETKLKEAQARENEAQIKALEEAQRAESVRLQSELEATRQQLLEATQKPSGFLSWLGLRKKRTSTTMTVSKTG